MSPLLFAALVAILSSMTSGSVTVHECVPTFAVSCRLDVPAADGSTWSPACWRQPQPYGKTDIWFTKDADDWCRVWEYAGALFNLRQYRGEALPACDYEWFKKRHPELNGPLRAREWDASECFAAAVAANPEQAIKIMEGAR